MSCSRDRERWGRVWAVFSNLSHQARADASCQVLHTTRRVRRRKRRVGVPMGDQ